MEAVETTINLEADFKRHQAVAQALRKEPVARRRERLVALRKWIHDNRALIEKALHDDFRKNPVEVDAVEIFPVLQEIQHVLNHLDNWTAPKKIDAPLTLLGTRSWIYYEPKGVCLIISPWNYPFNLSVAPLISAIAAGNTVVLKPSELTPNASRMLRKMASEVFADGVVRVVEGDAEVAGSLLRLPFDHIFFTGSPAIGKVVMKAAAENLTSVTLELGGKSPTIVCASANLRDAARRVAVSKFVNNGQTCIAPDYVLVEEKIAATFVEQLKEQVKRLFAENGDFEKSDSYCRIVNARHFTRLNDLLQDALTKGARLEMSGPVSAESRFIHPMILTQVSHDSRLLNEEIFGPILPVITFTGLGEAIRFINGKPKPLALYIFSNKAAERRTILQETTSGAVCINESAMHFFHSNLPFGGVNTSGIGKSHGHHGFLAFSNEKPVLKQKSGFTSVQLFHPPYTGLSRKIMNWFLRFF